MIYGIILGFIFGLATIALIGVGVWGWMEEGTARKCVGFILAPIMFILFLCIPFSFHQVDAGEVVVVKHMGQVSGVRTAGTYFDFWMTNTYEKYDAKVQTISIADEAYAAGDSSDDQSGAQAVDIKLTVQYRIKTTRADLETIATTYGSLETLQNRIESVALEKTKIVISRFTADNLILQRNDLSQQVTEEIKAALGTDYCIENVVAILTDITFNSEYEEVINAKMKAKQEAERAKIEAERDREVAIIKAEQELKTAELEAKAKIAKAQGDAEAQKTIADAEAYATQIKIVELARAMGFHIDEEEITDVKLDTEGNPVLTEDGVAETVVVGVRYSIDWDDDDEAKQMLINYLQYLEYLSKWNGELPGVVAGDSLELLIPSNPKD